MSTLTKLPKELYDLQAFNAFDEKRDFHVGAARACSWLCQLAYETDDPGMVGEILAAWGLGLPKGGIIAKSVATPLPIARTEAFLAAKDGVGFLSFAGTDPIVLEDWITDFRIRSSPDGVAEGFSIAAESVLPEIGELLRAIRCRALVVTGHSLGGALAVLAATSLRRAGFPVTSVYTFGMPRAGGEAFQRSYNALVGGVTYRLVHGADIVPSVPPSGLGFRHVGRVLHCPSWGKCDPSALASDPGSDEPLFLPQVVEGVRTTLLRPLGAGSLVTGAFRSVAALLRPNRHSRRNDRIGRLIDGLPPAIRDHLPDAYINTVT
ncbi:lipase family protein [Methylobacterium sp. V23]|uniref:lipase family protein n=1 Tax=Methylobacterium sp. V23 TaxID=2044878 RepID=UPI000CDB480B|nr:lipase family protein [Methylobacterium sp. V23]POR40052.1 hypothetical protein CRT23_25985 [Methylobacterium sp. V23]